ncbi:hypothetical protein C7534_11173 [Pseudomonas sp. OV226]|nr:hypothetical protein C7534_11173 [Pseudomonas sp. OV226]
MRGVRGMGGVVGHHLTLVSAFENKGELITATAHRKVFALSFSRECVWGVGYWFYNLVGRYC